MSNCLTTIAALPGSGGGAVSALRIDTTEFHFEDSRDADALGWRYTKFVKGVLVNTIRDEKGLDFNYLRECGWRYSSMYGVWVK